MCGEFGEEGRGRGEDDHTKKSKKEERHHARGKENPTSQANNGSHKPLLSMLFDDYLCNTIDDF